MGVEKKILNTLTTLFSTSFPVQHLYLALSGGADSCVLLDTVCSWIKTQKYLQLSAIHVHHGLSPQADAWTLHCIDICKHYQIDCFVEKVQVSKGGNIENNARQLRYGVFKKYIQSASDCLLTAHHQDDQAETLLLQLLRGTGIKGLGAMLPISPFSAGFLVRPLLDFSRDELMILAKQRNIAWVEDESNVDITFDRNYLRSAVIPILKQRWPALNKTLARTARHCQETQLFLDETLSTYFDKVKTSNPLIIKCQPLLKLSPVEQRFLLRYWLQQLGLQSPAEVVWMEILKIIHARPDAVPQVCFGTHVIRRYQDSLYLLTGAESLALEPIEWNFPDNLVLPGLGQLNVELTHENGLVPPSEQTCVTVRFREGGEKINPVGRRGHHTLKNLFQEWKVPVWERTRIPLIYYDKELVCIVGYCIAQKYSKKSGGYRINLIK